MKILIAIALALAAGAAHAACPGELVQLRVSKLKAGGTMAGFAAAARDNAAWYAARGMKDERFLTAPVYERTGGGEAKVSATKVMTMRVYTTTTAPKRDAAWEAFVAKYDANATIESSTLVCLPKGTIAAR